MEIIKFRYNVAGIEKEIEKIQLRREDLKNLWDFLSDDGFNVFVECGLYVGKMKDTKEGRLMDIRPMIFSIDSIPHMDVDTIAPDAENRDEIEKALEDIQLYLAGCRRLSRKRSEPNSLWEHPCLFSLSILTVEQRIMQIQKEYYSLGNDLYRWEKLLAIVKRFDKQKSALDSDKVKGDVFTMKTYDDVRMFSKLLIRKTENTCWLSMRPEDIPIDKKKKFPQKVVLLPFEEDDIKGRYCQICSFKDAKKQRNESFLTVVLMCE